jgi:hypothetical protein
MISAAFVEAPEGQIEQQEDDRERGRNDDLQPLGGPLQILELARIGDLTPGAEPHLAFTTA